MHLVSAAVLKEWNVLTDERVVARVLSGETALFELLIRRHNGRIYRIIRASVQNNRHAEDVMEHAYVKAYAHLRQFDGEAGFSTWLIRIAIDESHAWVRRRAGHEAFGDNSSIEEPFMSRKSSDHPKRQAFTGELRGLLEWAIDTLPEGLREVLVLHEIEGLSTSEVAESLQVSEDVVKTCLSCARAALQRVLMGRIAAALPEAFPFSRPQCDRVVAHVLARIAG